MAYNKPNYTQIPNFLLDVQLRNTSEAELKVLLAICRKTFGWHKKIDVLSYSQLEELTGLSRRSVRNGIMRAIQDGYVKRYKHGQSYAYRLLVNEVYQFEETSIRSSPEVGNKVNTQKKALNKSYSNSEISPFSFFENNIEPLTPLISEEIADLCDEYSEIWFIEACKEAAMAGKRNLRYINGILKNWRSDGYKTDKRPPDSSYRDPLKDLR